MKAKLFLFFLLSIAFLPGFAQTDLNLVFNSVHVGRNLSAVGKKQFDRHSIVFGLKYNINSIVHDNQGEVFKKRFFAKSFIEHWGLIAGYQYAIKLNKPYLEPYWFYELQFTNSHTRNPSSQIIYDADGNFLLYKNEINFFGPIIALENYLGVGLNIQLSKNIFLAQKAGIGMVNYQNLDSIRSPFINSTWEFGYIFSFGVMYRLKSKLPD